MRHVQHERSLEACPSECVAGEYRRCALHVGLLEQPTGLRRFRRTREWTGDQPPFLVGGHDAAGLETGDEAGAIGPEALPQRPDLILLPDAADLYAEPRCSRRNRNRRIEVCGLRALVGLAGTTLAGGR